MMKKAGAILILLFLALGIGSNARAQVQPDSMVTDSPKVNKSGVKSGGNTATDPDMGDVKVTPPAVTESPVSEEKEPKVKVKKEFDPDKAWKRSAILPGWGQFYNRTYWKPPIVYAGFGTLTYLWIWNNESYLSAREKYICSLDPNCLAYSEISTTSLKNEREFYRRNRDLTAIVGVVWYLLNVVDAYVEAHLKDFNVTDDISMRVKPALNYNPQRHYMTVGASLSLGFR